MRRHDFQDIAPGAQFFYQMVRDIMFQGGLRFLLSSLITILYFSNNKPEAFSYYLHWRICSADTAAYCSKHLATRLLICSLSARPLNSGMTVFITFPKSFISTTLSSTITSRIRSSSFSSETCSGKYS